MTESEITQIAAKAAKEAVKEVLEVLGLDVTTSAARLEVQRDFAHLRTLRLTGLAIRDKVLMAMTGAIGTGAVAGIWYFLLHGHT